MEVKCGTDKEYQGCPLQFYTAEKAQKLGEIAVCFVGMRGLPYDSNVERTIHLSGDESLADDSRVGIHVRMTIAKMGAGACN